ncbi:Uncharacterised protein [Serratia fonticola]|nr:Uncharacterised protein [Serratia fonticola]
MSEGIGAFMMGEMEKFIQSTVPEMLSNLK